MKIILREGPSGRLGIKASKEEVLRAYRQAWIDMLTPNNIKNAWRTSGIQPRNRELPLSSRFVMLEEEGVARKRRQAPTAEIRPKTPDFNTDEFNMPTPRLLARKAAKAFDRAVCQIANLEAKIEYLEAKVAKNTKNYRQKVKIAPGQRFVRMADVRRTRRRLRNRDIFEDEAADCQVPDDGNGPPEVAIEDVSEAEDCILVENTKK
ncbi:hypothetical protein F4803DRAFT_553556 [Xylaria telfairii]|nr:hypothetical protein F4803DRAFT_553556 [Xylaria telfairii]